ncbi:hypothetical protein BZZ01_28805 [Nostocales cyanobacterium HT-58-2]|nr:hypothetical protein BZZ01_28805 [Nostocales cyanobacterium HT-58-2]
MIWLKLVTQKAILACVLVLVVIQLPLCLSPAQAQSQRKSGFIDFVEKIKRFFFGIRPGGTPSGRERGGAVRDRCPNVAQPLTALVPSVNESPFVEQTISERPSFWFYVPYLSASYRKAEFVLIDDQEENVYAATFPLTASPGVVNLQLPKTVPPLQEGKQYRWVLSVICNPSSRSGDVTVNGWIERVPVSATLTHQLKAASTKERVLVYTDARLWCETLTTLAELQRSNPQDQEVKADWANVLQLIGLPENASKTWTTYSLPNQAENRRGNQIAPTK